MDAAGSSEFGAEDEERGCVSQHIRATDELSASVARNRSRGKLK